MDPERIREFQAEVYKAYRASLTSRDYASDAEWIRAVMDQLQSAYWIGIDLDEIGFEWEEPPF